MMKKLIAVLAVAVSMFLVAAPPADAARVVVRGGVWVGPGWGPYWGPYGGPWGYPYYYPPAYPYPPAVYEEPIIAEPPSYIQAPVEQHAPSTSYWYYCEGAKAYYPYVKECPGGWLTVVPPAAPEPHR